MRTIRRASWIQGAPVAQLIDGQRQSHMAVGIWLRKSTSSNVHLDRGHNQLWDGQLCVAAVAHVAEFLLGLSPTDVDVAPLFVPDGGLPSEVFPAIFRQVVVAHKDPSLIRKCHDLLDGLVEKLGGSTGEVTTGRAIVRHEEGVTSEESITNQIAYTRWRMTWSIHDTGGQFADLEGLPICKELVKLGAILLEVRPQIENSCEHILNKPNVFTNGNLSPHLSLDIGCR
mmetsp:Transcript_5582/g.6523  ORF Transcript_5582/g.6523 Transcript_5582/m.6523 type:complete len:228 (-) Transcript_5582:68-751(-)